MEYPTLEKLFHMDASSDRYAARERLLQERLNSESTFKTGIELETGELFLAVPRELSTITEQVLRRERRVSALWRDLPPVALGAFIRSLIMDEVVFSNEIEGVHSTRKQIETALELQSSRKHTPFAEFARLYLNLTEQPQPPVVTQDIRDIYDAIAADEISPEDLPGTSMFRTGPVEVINQQGRTIHKGIDPRSIEPMMEQWIGLSLQEDIPELYSAILCHFLFGYIHPFYDGNGRTGRYLLALHLSNPLSQPTVLSLSRTIAENKAAYYKAFDTTEKTLNSGEGTHFVLTLLELITLAQEQLIVDLESKKTALANLNRQLNDLEGALDARTCDVLFYAAQMHLYSTLQETRLNSLSEYLGVSKPTARKSLARLEDEGLLIKTSMRPPTYMLTDEGVSFLRLTQNDSGR